MLFLAINSSSLWASGIFCSFFASASCIVVSYTSSPLASEGIQCFLWACNSSSFWEYFPCVEGSDYCSWMSGFRPCSTFSFMLYFGTLGSGPEDFDLGLGDSWVISGSPCSTFSHWSSYIDWKRCILGQVLRALYLASRESLVINVVHHDLMDTNGSKLSDGTVLTA
jgi:hypothetical protein